MRHYYPAHVSVNPEKLGLGGGGERVVTGLAFPDVIHLNVALRERPQRVGAIASLLCLESAAVVVDVCPDEVFNVA